MSAVGCPAPARVSRRTALAFPSGQVARFAAQSIVNRATVSPVACRAGRLWSPITGPTRSTARSALATGVVAATE
jgi:hypothetical protein